MFVFFIPGHAWALKGKVTHHRHRKTDKEYGGDQPVSGSHIYMFAVNTAGYGSAPISLLHGSGVTVDNNGNGYVVTDAGGGFNLTGLYSSYCPTPNSSIYLQALGGDPGDGQNNSAIDFITALPLVCSQEPNASFVFVGEETTVAAAWALARYANLSPVGFSAGASNPQALLNAFTYANNLVSGYSGAVPGAAYNGSLTIPSAVINSMGNILAECVNDGSSSSACTQFFADATPVGGTAPTDILQAAMDVALNSSNNAAALFSLVPSSGAPFQPNLASAPASWSITYGIAVGNGTQGNSLTIDHTKVSNSNQVNFPILVSIPATTALATASNGGLVQNPNGYDILFSSDQAGQNLLDHEIDTYNPVNGSGAFWVRIPNLSHTSDTIIYMWYGIPNISNSLENALGVWSNNYLSVYHLGNGSTIGTMDSGIAGYTLLGTATPVAGEIGGAASFNGDATICLYHDYVYAYPTGSNPVTMEVWEQSWSNPGYAVGYGNASAGALFSFSTASGSLYADYYSQGLIGGPLPSSGWHHLVDVYGGGALSNATDGVYVDGVLQSSYVFSGTPDIIPAEFKIGGLPTTTAGYALSGSMDEVRISSGVRSGDWIATEYANQSSPNTFLTMQPAQLVPSAPTASLTMLSSSSDPSQFGSTVALTASVTSTNSGNAGSIPTGQVTFYDGPTNLGVVSVASPGVATLSTVTLAVGTHPVTAVYSGDSNYTVSTSTALSEVVSAVFNPTINCVPAVITSGENVTCALTLLPGASSAVSFSVNGSAWTSVTPDANGNAVANAVVSEATPGTYTVAFSYPGDPSIPVPSASGTAPVTVDAVGTPTVGNTIYSFSITDQNGNSGYAPNSNITAYTDGVNGTWSLGYDSLDRLTSSASTSAMRLSQSGCWAYDSFGNMLTQGVSSQSFSNSTTCQAQSGAITLQSSFNFSAANQITSGTWLDSSNDTHTGSPGYDSSGNGNMTNDLVNTYVMTRTTMCVLYRPVQVPSLVICTMPADIEWPRPHSRA